MQTPENKNQGVINKTSAARAAAMAYNIMF